MRSLDLNRFSPIILFESPSKIIPAEQRPAVADVFTFVQN
jgi:hypothetical protein